MFKKSGVTGTRSITMRSPLLPGMARRLVRDSESPCCNRPAYDVLLEGVIFLNKVVSSAKLMLNPRSSRS